MTWTTARDLKTQLARLWERGDLLRDAVTASSRFPLRLAIKGPSSAELTERFEAVRTWVAALSEAGPFRLEWQEVRHRVQGVQRLPAGAWIDSSDDALRCLGRRGEWRQFAGLVDLTRRQFPALLPWLEKRPLQALDLAGTWDRLLAVVAWVEQHPRPGIFLRQVDLPGVHSKFIEAHRAVLAELLDRVLPPASIDTTRTGVGQFAARYGFLEKPARIRFRILDPGVQVLAHMAFPGPGADLTLDAASFSRLDVAAVRQVLITENETNFLALPRLPGAMAIFGSGYGWDALAQARWLEECAIHYWGDIDTHGFAILDQLRGQFPHAVSILMDRATLDAHESFWGREDKPHRGDLLRLAADEAGLFNDLRDNRIREGLRLEQELLGFDWVRERIDRLSSIPGA